MKSNETISRSFRNVMREAYRNFREEQNNLRKLKEEVDSYILEQGLQMAALSDRLTKSEYFKDIILELSDAVSSSVPLEEIFQMSVREISRFAKVENCFIFTYDPEKNEFVGRAGTGESDATVSGERFKIGMKGQEIARIARREFRLPLEEMKDSFFAEGRIAIDILNPAMFITVPLMVKDKVVGALTLDHRRREHPFEPGELEGITLMANQLAIAIENAQLSESLQAQIREASEASKELQECADRLRKAYRDLQIIYDISSVISSTTDLNDIFQLVVEKMPQLLDVDRCFLFTYDEISTQIRGQAATGRDDKAIKKYITKAEEDQTICGEVIRRGETVQMINPEGSPFRCKTFLGIPMIVKDRILGCIVLGDSRMIRNFDPEAVSKAERVTGQIAMAVGNLQLMESHMEKYEELLAIDEELRGAYERLRDAEARYAALFEGANDAIIITDVEGGITELNAAAEEMLGYSREKILGKNLLTEFLIEDTRRLREIMDSLKRGRKVSAYETRIKSKYGKGIDISAKLFPIRDSDGRIIGYSAICRDIGGRREPNQRSE
ncbi:MAG: GAF domain-containing protein [bacterium]